MAGLMLALFLVALDQTIVGTALPKIIADLEGFSQYAWVTTAYLLATTAMIPVVGKLGDIYGRKWFILAGIAIFLVGSVLCGLAWGMTELIIFRGIQGLGAGFIFSNIFTSIADVFPDPARRAKYQGIFFGVFSLSSVVGPALGGWITDNLDWRWVFYINVPLGIFSLFVLPIVLPQSGQRRRAKIDYFGAVTITASVVALLLALSWVGEGYDWEATRVIVGFVVSAVLLAVFIPIELRATEPIIPFSLFKNRVFTSAALLMFLVGIGMFGIILYTPLFVQGSLGKSATGSGTILTPLVFAMTGVGVVGGQVIARVKRVKPFTLLGTILMTLGVYLLTTLDVNSGTGTVALFLVVTGLGLGLIMPTATLAVQATVDKKIIGVATSATQFIRSLGSTVGTAVIGSLVTKGYAEDLTANAPPQAPGQLVSALENPQALVSDEARDALSNPASAFPGAQQLVDEVITVARQALSDSIHDGFVFTLLAVGVAIFAALLMTDIRLEPSGAGRMSAPVGWTDGDSALLTGITLAYLTRRIENANGDSPNLVRMASELVLPNGDASEHDRALRANEEVLKPLSQTLLTDYLQRKNKETATREGVTP
jgi:EmrB/QacA subfamily drug resistance transporter